MTRFDWAAFTLAALIGVVHGFLGACWLLAVDERVR